MLEVEGLIGGYGFVTVLRDISLSTGRGEIVTVVGANGAGKSTLLKMISGLIPSTAGRIRFDGKEIGRKPAHEIVRLGVSLVPEGRQLFAELSVQDNLALGAYSLSRSARSMARELGRVHEMFPILKERSSQLAGTLSGGEQQMLAIGRALMARPRLLLLDEPSLGLAPKMVRTIFDTIGRLKEADLGILLVEQNARAALAMADRAYALETGKVIAAGTGRELLDDATVRRSYLGDG